MEDLPLGRTVTLVLEFAVEDLPLGRIAILFPEFAVEDLRSADSNLGSWACSEACLASLRITFIYSLLCAFTYLTGLNSEEVRVRQPL